jgi:prepilin-type N-terminal cleavage/methylation domain-containing protein
MKKGFTLIELLIVVAIIGILGGVGIPMYNGYMTKAKIESTKANYASIKSFTVALLTKCSAGAAHMSSLNSNTVYISTNIGNESGGNVYLRDTIVAE